MSHARAWEVSDDVSEIGADELMAQFEHRVPDLVDRITDRVQTDIPAYAGSPDGRRRGLIEKAVSEAVSAFVRGLDGRPPTPTVNELFRQMGYGETADGNDLEALFEALRIAVHESWDELRAICIAAGLGADQLGALGDRVFDLIDHLQEQARAGRALAHRVQDRDVTRNRVRLLTALLHPHPEPDVTETAELAQWPVRAELTVLAARAASTVTWPTMAELDGLALIESGEDGAVAVCTVADRQLVVKRLRAAGRGVRVALSGTVAAEDVPAAHGWTTRALALAEAGIMPRQPVLECESYRTELWLHAEPVLRRRLAQELLQPLFTESPNSREILSETLLVWLETRGSAPTIAGILGVHPQTVRYRWKRINELLGNVLEDPTKVLMLTMVLKASVPMWLAGDQSDFRMPDAPGADRADHEIEGAR